MLFSCFIWNSIRKKENKTSFKWPKVGFKNWRSLRKGLHHHRWRTRVSPPARRFEMNQGEVCLAPNYQRQTPCRPLRWFALPKAPYFPASEMLVSKWKQWGPCDKLEWNGTWYSRSWANMPNTVHRLSGLICFTIFLIVSLGLRVAKKKIIEIQQGDTAD